MSRRRSSEPSPTRTPSPQWGAHPPRTLNELLYHDTVKKAFANEAGNGTEQFSKTSVVDVFEISPEHGGILREQMDDAGIRDWLKLETRPTRMRLLFIDAILDWPDMLPVTESVLRDILETFKVNPRFIDILTRQHMPGREVHRHKTGNIRHEMWYTAVLRSDGSAIRYQNQNQINDLSRQFAYWQRFCMWSDYQSQGQGNGSDCSAATYMIWRCPHAIKQAFFRTFTGETGTKLLDNPMAVHAFIMDKILLRTYDFLAYFSGPLYRWEKKASELQTPDDYTARSRAFLALARQIHQISTDYDILQSSIQHLKAQTEWFRKTLNARADIEDHIQDAQSTMDDIFENLTKEVKLIGTYTSLYLERSKIGVDECFAMINQRDSELNIQIAQASNQDNRSLRIIQILSMIFLPGSLVSSVFGMGFFTTSPGDNGGDAVFAASSRWWLYFAVSVPLTAIVMVVMLYYQWRDSGKAEEQWSWRRSSAALDPEAQSLRKKQN
ncbi:uncharacterized protein BCR38DRAFT_422242 [Pseudomassariella vexata]|uniref:Uncharacterized protein n=1 Tax=Pseudomassariella vexata TaxID=1141098 RepID=A0A1Y2EGF2_9PEZI|nr:uncharacterized protein BCR38DRAFT_422242 [Pseudomassariella vexata]ORY70497.1 hypothetical protein BCR38DRAFT_422242 [Pseudomassariella vexata]